MADLAARWSELLLAEDLPRGVRVADAVSRNGSVLRPAASEEQILDAEERLGRRLPPSYREFLLASNGAYADTEGIARLRLYAPATGELDGIGFLPVQQIGWLRDRDPDAASQLAMPDDEDYGPVEEDGQRPVTITPLADGLWITPDTSYEGMTVLIPFDGDEE